MKKSEKNDYIIKEYYTLFKYLEIQYLYYRPILV